MKQKNRIMKTSILTLALVISSFANANNDGEIKEKQKINISEQKRIEIVNKVQQSLFFWEIKSKHGVASGFTNSIESAKKTIKLMSTNDVVSSKIIETYK